MLPTKKTKILATLGPSSNTVEIIQELVLSGANLFRMNFSHGTHADHESVYNNIRTVEDNLNVNIGVVADLQGPKLRISTFKNSSETLVFGQEFILTLRDILGDSKQVNLPHPEIFDITKIGDKLLINDGKISLKVISTTDTDLVCEVTIGGIISNRKGVNVPNAILKIDALTAKDKEDLDFALNLGVDWVALSFVQRPEDIVLAKTIIKDRAKIISKIEKPSAITNIEEIIDVSDGVMIARGDLGVECPAEDVPLMQKRIIRSAQKYGKPVIVATQMLESMISEAVPTRAEINDVANAILDGSDALMLSAETASGEFPVEAVLMMKNIAERIESDSMYHTLMQERDSVSNDSNTDIISQAVMSVANNSNCKAIVTFTATGATALRMARLRPMTQILALTAEKKSARWMTLIWGCVTINTKDVRHENEIVGKATRVSKLHNFTKDGDDIVVVAGLPFGTPGTTNILQIARVGEYEK